MDAFSELLRDKHHGHRPVTTLVIVIAAVALGTAAGRLAGSRLGEPYTRYYARKAVHYVTFAVLLVALAMLWRPFAGRVGVVLGLAAAASPSRCRKSSAPSRAGRAF